MVSTYRDMPFEGKCILFLFLFVFSIVAIIIDKNKIKNDKYILISTIAASTAAPVTALGEIAKHFSWSPIIVAATVYSNLFCLLVMIVALSIRKIKLGNKKIK